jgi:hypothetical protein
VVRVGVVHFGVRAPWRSVAAAPASLRRVGRFGATGVRGDGGKKLWWLSIRRWMDEIRREMYRFDSLKWDHQIGIQGHRTDRSHIKSRA